MLELLTKIEPMVTMISQILLAVMILATLASQVIGRGKYAEKVGSISEKVLSFIQYLPTLGINPKTKKLEDALKDVRKDESA